MEERDQRRIFDEWLGRHKGRLFKVVQTYGFTSQDRDDLFQEIATAFNFPMKDVDQTVDEVIPHPTDRYT